MFPLLAAALCASCHPAQVSGYAKTAMANSLGRPVNQPSGSFTHALSGSRFVLRPAGQKLQRHGLTAEHAVEYVIGSGNHAFGYLVRVGDYLFQSPVSYYSRRKLWDMAPGYENDRSPDFTRPVTAECLLCHSGRPRPVAETVNRYQDPPFTAEGISCDRCHGAAEAHVRRPSAANIINPRKLAARARDSICEQCHLGGEARIENPGRHFGDFQPGQELEQVFSVYVNANPAFKVVSHAEQLARSICAVRSGTKMWCGSCHDPHEKPAQSQQYYRARCLACHGEAPVKAHPGPSDDCVACHMLRRPAQDGGHTAFTDHRILRRPQLTELPAPTVQLAAWHEPARPLAKRNLALAYVAAAERHQSAAHMYEGMRLLEEVRQSFPEDPAVATGLGLALLGSGRSTDSIRLFEQALRLRPGYAPYYLNLGAACKEAGQGERAAQQLERAIELDPSLERAYQILTEIYFKANQPAKVRQTLERYRKFNPQSMAVQRALAR